MMDQRCWRWVWLHQREGDFFPWWIGYMQSLKWAKVREEKKREKTHRTSIGVWVDVGPSMKYGVELRLSVVDAWGWSWGELEDEFRGVWGVCEEWPIQKSIEGKMEREIHLRHGNCKAYFTVKLISIFSLTVFSSGTKQTPECKTFLDFSLHAKQTQL